MNDQTASRAREFTFLVALALAQFVSMLVLCSGYLRAFAGPSHRDDGFARSTVAMGNASIVHSTTTQAIAWIRVAEGGLYATFSHHRGSSVAGHKG